MVKQKYCPDQSDNELVALTLKRAEDFACLIGRYENQLLAYIRRISSLNQEDAEDILQEVFIKVFYNLNDFDTNLKFSSWIYRITHNETMSELRKRQARPMTSLTEDEWQNLASQNDLLREINGHYDQTAIEKSFRRLDEKYQEVFLLRFVEGRDYREISDILRQPVNTIGTLIARARKKFKEEFIKINPDRYDRIK
jgi:RNA polymerase sigma-70 factor (ECF subfamily)